MWLARSQAGNDSVDAVLTSADDTATGVVAYPNNGLGNDNVEGDTLPSLSVTDHQGAAVESASWIGQPLAINFWFSTCPPCATELPDFAEVHDELGDQVRFIGINPYDTPAAMERFAASRGVDYELYLDEGFNFTNALRIAAFPVTLFVDSNGQIVEQTGVLDADELRSAVNRLIEASS